MKRILIALGVGVAMFAIVAYAATLTVSTPVAATGGSEIANCGNVEGSTFVLESQAMTFTGADTAGNIGSNGTADITEFWAVNIEVPSSCGEAGGIGNNIFVEVKTGSGGSVIASGFCQANNNDGFGYDEASTTDNTPGCTAVVGDDTSADDDLPNVSDAWYIVVTET